MRYINEKTCVILETDSLIEGGDWVLYEELQLEETVEETIEEKEPKKKKKKQ